MFWEQNVQVAVETDIGLRRKNNEDSSCAHLSKSEDEWRRHGHLFIVADGMGGHAVGELASRMAVEMIPHTFQKATEGDIRKTLRDAVATANSEIHTRGIQNEDFLHMGTTCTVMSLCSHGVIIAHVGDSRAYRVRRDRIDQLTFDHSLEWELERNNHRLASQLDLSQHRNIITRSLGPEPNVDVDLEGPYPVLPNDIYVLCSDGLSNQLDDAEVGAIVRELPPKKAAKLLIHLANIRGGPDNTTVIIAHIGELPANVEPTLIVEEPDDRPSIGWAWLIGFWAAGMFLVGGVTISAFGQFGTGVVITVISLLVFIGLLIGALRQHRKLVADQEDRSKTHLGRPHRTAVSLESKDLYKRLAKIASELQRAAREDGWNVDWKRFDESVQTAEKAAAALRYSRGVRDLSQAISTLMEEHPHPNEA